MLDPLTLDQLRVLVSVAEEGSFSAAARRLGRVQSAISQAVHALETALGVTALRSRGKGPPAQRCGPRAPCRCAPHDPGRRGDQGEGRELQRGRRAGADARGRRDVPERGPDREPQGVERSLSLPPGDRLHRGDGRRRAAAPRRRGAARPLCSDPGHRPTTAKPSSWSRFPMVPVVAIGHPLAALPGPLSRPISRRRCSSSSPTARTVSTGSAAASSVSGTWRFADLATRASNSWWPASAGATCRSTSCATM